VIHDLFLKQRLGLMLTSQDRLAQLITALSRHAAESVFFGWQLAIAGDDKVVS
jgi:hypothetical protein